MPRRSMGDASSRTHPQQSREVALAGWQGLGLRAEAWGEPDAPPVVLLHGGGQTRHAWGTTARALAGEGRFVLALDQRGHGQSEWAPDGNYRLAAFVEDLRAVLATLSGPPALVGASLGGLVALLLAGETTGFRGSALVLVDVAPRLERRGAQRVAEFMTARPEGFASLEQAAGAVARYARHRQRDGRIEGLEKNLRRQADGSYRWHWDPRLVSASGPVEVTDEARLLAAARSLPVPALIVRGRESDVVSPEAAAVFVEVAPRAEYADVSGAGHMLAGDRNDAFTEAVIAFLRRVAPV